MDDVCEIIQYPNDDWSRWIKIRVVHAGPDEFRYGLDFWTGENGLCFGPSMRSPSFKTLHEAKDNAVKDLIRKFAILEIEEIKSYKKVIAWLWSLSQLSLF